MATPAIYAGDTTVGQSGTNAALTVFLSEASAMTITVRRSLAAKNAIPTVVTNDNVPEPIENFNFVLSSHGANTLVSNSLAFATLIDNDAAPLARATIRVSDALADEKAAGGTVSLNYLAAEGTATGATDDYQALARATPVMVNVSDACMAPPSDHSPRVLAAAHHCGRKNPPR